MLIERGDPLESFSGYKGMTRGLKAWSDGGLVLNVHRTGASETSRKRAQEVERAGAGSEILNGTTKAPSADGRLGVHREELVAYNIAEGKCFAACTSPSCLSGARQQRGSSAAV